MLLVSRGLKSQIYAHVSQLYKQFTKEVVESNKLAWAFPPRQLTDSAEANADAIVPFCVLVCVCQKQCSCSCDPSVWGLPPDAVIILHGISKRAATILYEQVVRKSGPCVMSPSP